MKCHPLEIPFGPKPAVAPLYEFLDAAVDDATLMAIASADYWEGADEAFGLLAATLRTAQLPTCPEQFPFVECVELSSYRTDAPPLTRLTALSLLLHLEAEQALSFCEWHANALAGLVSAAVAHSPAAATAATSFVSWLAMHDGPEWPRSFHVLGLLLLLIHIDRDSVGSAETTFLEQVFDAELRENAESVIGYDNELSGHAEALEMIADGDLPWLLCLDVHTRDHRPWIHVVGQVLGWSRDRPEIERLRRKLCPTEVPEA